MKNNSYKITDIIKSFKIFPKSFALIRQIKKRFLIMSLLSSIIVAIIPIIGILVNRALINSLQLKNKNFEYTLYIFIIMILVRIVGIISNNIGAFINKLTSDEFAYYFSTSVLNKCITLKLRDYEDSNIYDLIKRAENEAGVRPYKIFTSLIALVTNILSLFMAMIIVIQWNWWSGIILIALPILLSFYFFKISKNEHEVYMNRTKNERKSWYVSLLLTKDSTFKEIKFYDLGEYLVEKYKNIRYVFVSENKILYKKRCLFSIIFSVLNYILMSIIIFFIILSAFMGEILIGTAMSIINSLSSLETSFKQLINTIIEMHEDNLYIEQFIKFLELETDDKELNRKNLININEIESIEMKNVSYKYPNSSEWVLKNINFKIINGEKVSLVGKNGSGKSTLIKILSCQYDDYEGQVLINGIDLRMIDKKKVLQRMGIVYQDFNKYEFNLRENISLGDLKKINNDTEIIDCLCKASGANILNKINSIDQQLGVWFEKGIQLSGGEWQKLAIARAFFREGDIYILDEPSAALDALAEYEMFKNFSKLIRNKIGLFITHKIDNARFADKIIVLKDGCIVEKGTFHELTSSQGEFFELLNAKERK